MKYRTISLDDLYKGKEYLINYVKGFYSVIVDTKFKYMDPLSPLYDLDLNSLREMSPDKKYALGKGAALSMIKEAEHSVKILSDLRK